MADAAVDDSHFESRLESRLRKCYQYSLRDRDRSYEAASKKIADALRAVNRTLEEGLILTEEYCELADVYSSVEGVGDLVESTLSVLGESGLTAKMAVDVVWAYAEVSPCHLFPDVTARAANSTLETIKETYQNVKYAKMLISSYPDTIDGIYDLDELSTAVNTTLKTLKGANFKREDVELLIETYKTMSTSANNVTELCSAVCRTVEYAKQNRLELGFQLGPIIRKLKKAAAEDKDKEYSAKMLCDMVTGIKA